MQQEVDNYKSILTKLEEWLKETRINSAFIDEQTIMEVQLKIQELKESINNMSANELNIGDYCYIKGISRDYGIGKITQLNSGYSSNGGELIDIQFKHSKHSVPKIEVISSPNIIDLISRFDLVNGHLVICKMYEDEKDIPTIIKCVGDYYFKEEEIKSVITHEQMEQMVYKVEE